MLEMNDEQYKKEYDEALAKLDGTAEEATIPEPEPEPEKEPEAEPVKEEIKTEPDPLAEVRAELEKTKKALNDTKAWGTKNAQRLAELERQTKQQSKPEILDANPELADAIRYVTSEPTETEKQIQNWQAVVQAAHPGIFDLTIDPELEAALVAKREALGEAWYDPLIAIREITAEKLAFTERQVGKRFAIEAAKQSQKSAMSVPGAGGGANRTTTDTDQEAVQRIQKMSDAAFAEEVRRVKGY